MDGHCDDKGRFVFITQRKIDKRKLYHHLEGEERFEDCDKFIYQIV
jgi:hypothetical protein